MTANNDAAQRWEIAILVGPCSESAVEGLMLALVDHEEVRALGGAVSAQLWQEDDEDD